ncbi:hypothetical protein FTX61_08655 [Nitriliruptoraceae bacterium ZYF776]|nr:hypothetical protein [Profundirhabdus halotolerans]
MGGTQLARTVGRVVAAGRVGLGLAMVAAPAATTSRWLGDDEDEGRDTAVRALGIRDLAIGAGALLALRDPSHDAEAERWLEAAVVADLGDAAATLRLARDRDRTLVVALALSAAACGLFARARLR